MLDSFVAATVSPLGLCAVQEQMRFRLQLRSKRSEVRQRRRVQVWFLLMVMLLLLLLLFTGRRRRELGERRRRSTHARRLRMWVVLGEEFVFVAETTAARAMMRGIFGRDGWTAAATVLCPVRVRGLQRLRRTVARCGHAEYQLYGSEQR